MAINSGCIEVVIPRAYNKDGLEVELQILIGTMVYRLLNDKKKLPILVRWTEEGDNNHAT